MNRIVRGLSVLGLFVGMTVTMAGAEVGSKAPEWNNLPGADGKTHSLKDLKDAKAVVVVFTCNHCPVAVAYEDRFIDFAKKYSDKDVELVAINLDNHEDLAAVTERAKEKDFPFQYLNDASQKSGKDYGAIKTPHIFVLDGDRNIVFAGPFDDKVNSPEKVSKHYVADAVDAVLAGKSPEVGTVLPHGCGIHYEK